MVRALREQPRTWPTPLEGADVEQLTLFGFCRRGHARTPDNVYPNGTCRRCAIDRSRLHRLANAEANRTYQREWSRRNKSVSKAWYARKLAENPRYFAEQSARQRRDKPGQVALAKRRYYEANKAQWVERKARRKFGRDDPDSVTYAGLVVTDPCCYCGNEGGTVDHIVPVSQQGPENWTNYTGSCGVCNSTKNDRSLLTFLSKRALVVGS